jgi:hypothetical protein
LLEITTHFAGVIAHSDEVKAFRALVSREAGMVATVDWSRRFPNLYKTVAQYLLFHTMLVSHAHAHVLDLHATGFPNITDLLHNAQREVSLMHSLGLVSDFELVWHLAKLDQEHAKVLQERSFLHELAAMPQLGRASIAALILLVH